MTDNAVLKHGVEKKAASLSISGDPEGERIFSRPRLWEVDEATKGDSWCD